MFNIPQRGRCTVTAGKFVRSFLTQYHPKCPRNKSFHPAWNCSLIINAINFLEERFFIMCGAVCL